ncbi:MAG: hypothetical protein M3Y09_00355 [Actinomycetota bacterium]|nr:hypothetical protein [Actinomycetota bacterium]
MNKLIQIMRSNAIALLSLFIALGGTSYAALSLPVGSVGTRQLRNGSVTPAKLNAHTIGGAVRNWAFVNQDGTILGGSHGVHVSEGAGGAPYYVSWGDRFAHSCAVLANSPGTEGFAPIADTVGIHVNEPGSRHGATVVWVYPYNNGAFVNARFYIAVVC